MKKITLFLFLFLSVFSLSAQEQSGKIKKNSLLFAEVGYMADYPYKNGKYKIAVQHTFWDFIGISAGYWHYSDHSVDFGTVKRNISINSLDFSLGIVPVYTVRNFLSFGAGYSYGHIKQNKPIEITFNPVTGEIKNVITGHMNEWTGGWHFYLQYHYNFNAFFIGTGLYYYSFNDINDLHSFSGFNANIAFGIQFK